PSGCRSIVARDVCQVMVFTPWISSDTLARAIFPVVVDQRLIAGTAVVTGGGSGLGRAIARGLAEGGAPVAVVDLLADGATEPVELITKAGGRATFVPADVSRWDDVDRAVGDAVRQLGPLAI